MDHLADSVAQGDLGLATGFTPNTKIQVLWTLHENAESEDDGTDIWWPATVVGRTSTFQELPKNEDEEDEPGSLDRLPVYEIRYDPMLPDFPNPQLSSVCVLDDHHLLDAEAEGSPTLPWRHVGSTWEEEDDDEEKKEVPDSIKALVERLEQNQHEEQEEAPKLSPEAARTVASEFVESLISSLTTKHSVELGNLPRSNQNAIVDRVIQIKAVLVEKLACRLTSTGCVSEEDAKSIVEELKAA